MKKWYCRVAPTTLSDVPIQERYPLYEFMVEAETIAEAKDKALQVGLTVARDPEVIQITQVMNTGGMIAEEHF